MSFFVFAVSQSYTISYNPLYLFLIFSVHLNVA